MIDTAELVRVMSTLHVRGERPRPVMDTTPLDTAIHGDEHRERPGERPVNVQRGRPVNVSRRPVRQSVNVN